MWYKKNFPPSGMITETCFVHSHPVTSFVRPFPNDRGPRLHDALRTDTNQNLHNRPFFFNAKTPLGATQAYGPNTQSK